MVFAHGKETHLHRQVEGEGLLNQTARGENIIIGMRGEHEKSIAIAQMQGDHGGLGPKHRQGSADR